MRGEGREAIQGAFMEAAAGGSERDGGEGRDGVKGCRTMRGVCRAMTGQKERAEPGLKVCVPHIPEMSPTLPGTVLGAWAFGRGFGYKGATLRNGRSDL